MLSVAAKRANVHSGPGDSYEVLWQAAVYYPLEVIARDGSWVKVSDFEKDEGWIYKPLLSGVPTVVVVAKRANVRKGPGMEYASLWVLDKEYSLKVLDSRGDWLKVSDGDGVSGWIHKSVTWGFSGKVLIVKNQD